MPDISICCLLYNSELTRAGALDGFFRHIAEIEDKSPVSTERMVLVDDRTTDRSMEIAKEFCDPRNYHFENFSQAKNLLLEQAAGKWVFMPEPDMRYDVGAVVDILQKLDRFGQYKSVETWQWVHSPGEKHVKNFYYFLIDPSARFEGPVFETLRAYPHEILRAPEEIGDHFTRKRSERMQNAQPLYTLELEHLNRRRQLDDPEELYWTAMRYSELGMMDCLPLEEMDRACVSLLEKAIALKRDFGPAYFELAKQHLMMNRKDKALEVARQGYDNSGYEYCLHFCREVGRTTLTIVR